MEILSQENFEEKIKDGVVLVDFFATWCGPCKMLSPILEQASKETTAKIFKVDVDACYDIAKSFGIMSVPTMILFKDGKIFEKIIGLRQKQQILDLIKSAE
ncbi:MAG: thioredoxin [Clostridia bacterium]